MPRRSFTIREKLDAIAILNKRKASRQNLEDIAESLSISKDQLLDWEKSSHKFMGLRESAKSSHTGGTRSCLLAIEPQLCDKSRLVQLLLWARFWKLISLVCNYEK